MGAHAIKGGAWNLHSAALGDAAKAVEDACASEDRATAENGLGPLRREADRLKRYVESVDFSAFENI